LKSYDFNRNYDVFCNPDNLATVATLLQAHTKGWAFECLGPSVPLELEPTKGGLIIQYGRYTSNNLSGPQSVARFASANKIFIVSWIPKSYARIIKKII
jgi:hypothetical protein